MRIRIAWDNGSVEAILANTLTAQKVRAFLPCISSASIWGEEVYLTIPVQTILEPDAC